MTVDAEIKTKTVFGNIEGIPEPDILESDGVANIMLTGIGGTEF